MSSNTVLSAPIPPYQNLPIESQNYQPSVFDISAITLGLTTIVTTTANMNYVVGQEVRLIIPPQNGSRQLNGRTGFVISLPASNEIEISINSSQNVDPFINTTYIQPAQVVAVGDVNNGYINPNGRNNTLTGIYGSFINIS